VLVEVFLEVIEQFEKKQLCGLVLHNNQSFLPTIVDGVGTTKFHSWIWFHDHQLCENGAGKL
jgi:hypothetical protein